MSPKEKGVIPWFTAKGDTTLRLNYDLNENSIVFDLGGYMGQWTSDIFAKYCCTVYCFEPVRHFYEGIERRFAKNNKVKVYRFGLAGSNRTESISLLADGSSLYRGEKNEGIQLVEFDQFMTQKGIEKIDLVKINIEGGEYELLEHLIEKKIVNRIDNIQVQFHDFVKDASERMEMIQRRLSETHAPTYQYEFVWENWRRI